MQSYEQFFNWQNIFSHFAQKTAFSVSYARGDDKDIAAFPETQLLLQRSSLHGIVACLHMGFAIRNGRSNFFSTELQLLQHFKHTSREALRAPLLGVQVRVAPQLLYVIAFSNDLKRTTLHQHGIRFV